MTTHWLSAVRWTSISIMSAPWATASSKAAKVFSGAYPIAPRCALTRTRAVDRCCHILRFSPPDHPDHPVRVVATDRVDAEAGQRRDRLRVGGCPRMDRQLGVVGAQDRLAVAVRPEGKDRVGAGILRLPHRVDRAAVVEHAAGDVGRQ